MQMQNLIENNCTKCKNNLLAIYENETIISCIEVTSLTPDRIDIIKNGKFADGIIEIKPDYDTKTHLSDGIKNNTSAMCTANPSNYYLIIGGKDLLEVLNLVFQFILLFQKIISKGQNKLNGEY